MGDIVCVGCADTGRNSKGGVCVPCQKNGRHPVRSGVLRAVGGLFDRMAKDGAVPTQEEVVAAVAWAYAPAITYGAGYRGKGGVMAMFGGPTPDLHGIYETVPGDGFNADKPAFVIEFTKTTFGGEPKARPIARWKGDRWVSRKAK